MGAKNKQMTRSGALLAGLSLAVVACNFSYAAECTPKHQFKTVEPGVLTVALDVTPPFGYVETGGGYKGIEADVLKKFAERECLTVKPLVVKASAAIQYVVSGRADMTQSGWFVTKDRAKVMNYAAPMYIDRNAIYSKEGWSKLSEVEGKKVGTVQGFMFVPELKEIYGSDLKLYPSVTAAIQDLNSGRIEAAFITTLIGTALERENAIPGVKIKVIEPDKRVVSTIEPAQVGMMYNKQNSEFGTALNDAIVEFRKSGELETIAKQYGLTSEDVNKEELRYIQ